jgi:hypothetical protein
MASTIAIVFEGGLKGEVHDSPIKAGILLYRGVALIGRVAILVDRTPMEKVEHWLNIQNLHDHSWIILPRASDPIDSVERRLLQVARLRSEGAAVELVLEPNPAIAAALQGSGIATALFMHPATARPEYRPDYEGHTRPWATLEAEIDRQLLMTDVEPTTVARII